MNIKNNKLNIKNNKLNIKNNKFLRQKKIKSLKKKNLNLQKIIEKIYDKLKGRYDNAKNADYIPILKNMDPNIFQISIYPVKNNSYGFESKIHNVGNFIDEDKNKIEVSIQSVSKVFNLGLAIKIRNKKNDYNNRTGLDDLLEYIGTEESFMGFNDIKAQQMLNGKQGVPFTINPFINAGAIATVSFITPTKTKTTYQQMIDNINRFSGHDRERHFISLATFESEMKWIDTNKNLAKYLKKISEKYYNKNKNIKKFKYFQGNKDTLDVKSSLANYTSICSMLVNSKELVDMTYTLANKGINSKGEKILSCQENKYILSALIFGGMYNASGQWFQKLGIPMKSGVGGAIIGIIPGEMAISVISPPLDSYGNSYLGGKVMEELANELRFHANGFCKYKKLKVPKKSKKILKLKKVNLKREKNLKSLESIIDEKL